MATRGLSAERLREELWQVMDDIRNERIDIQAANAYVQGAKAICSSVKLQLQAFKMADKKPSAKTQKFLID